jgi:hypothetical protein
MTAGFARPAGPPLGAPHGAVDHLLPQPGTWPARGTALLGRALRYVTAAAAALAVCLVAPVAGIAAIIVWLDAAEVLVLLALVLAVPPLAAFGIYFALWHALRQYVRLYTDARGGRAPVRDGYPLPRVLDLRSLASATAVGTLATVAFGLAAYGAVSGHADAIRRFHMGEWLTALLVSLIAPHMVTTLGYDRWKVQHAGANLVSVSKELRS